DFEEAVDHLIVGAVAADTDDAGEAFLERGAGEFGRVAGVAARETGAVADAFAQGGLEVGPDLRGPAVGRFGIDDDGYAAWCGWHGRSFLALSVRSRRRATDETDCSGLGECAAKWAKEVRGEARCLSCAIPSGWAWGRRG